MRGENQEPTAAASTRGRRTAGDARAGAVVLAAHGLELLHAREWPGAAVAGRHHADLRWLLYAALAQGLAGIPAAVFRILAGPRVPVLQRAVPAVLTDLAADVGAALAGDGPLDWARDVGALHEGLLGLEPVHEGRLRLEDRKTSARRAAGAYYTPPALVEQVLTTGLQPLLRTPTRQNGELLGLTVADPACGAGIFLVAAARRLAAAVAPQYDAFPEAVAAVVARCVHGADRDPQAAALARAALWIEGGGRVPPERLVAAVAAGDALAGRPLPAASFDAVIGNPPFLGQLSAATVVRGRERAALRARFGPAVRPYTDPAALFLLAGLELARPAGRVALVQPQSLVAVRDASPVRARIAENGALVHLWIEERPVFGAQVRVCIPTIVAGGQQAAVRRSAGIPPRPLPPRTLPAGSWAPLLADHAGVPEVDLHGAGSVADLARVTADFRDQYYGLVGHVHEHDVLGAGGAPLVTSGLVDPARCWWGARPARFARRRFAAPAVDVAAVDGGPLGPWLRDRLVPKVLVATQTRVLEAVVDRAGAWVPSVPLIVCLAAAEDLDRLAALLCSPAVSAWALRTHGGAALSAGAVKLSAAQVAGVPLPGGERRWAEAGAAFASAQRSDDRDVLAAALRESGAKVHEAFGLGRTASRALLDWWSPRLPRACRPGGAMR